jgi:hypothetical protein
LESTVIITLELWHLITLLLAFFGCVAGFGKILLAEFEKRQGERFDAQEASRKSAQAHWDLRFSTLEKGSDEWMRLERDFLKFRAELPMTYVIRDDYVRNQTVIEAKLDALALRLENAQLKGII